MNNDLTKTCQGLQSWNSGNPEGLDILLDRHLPWIQNHVRKRLGPILKSKGETIDYVQDAMIEFLKFGPRFVMSSDHEFRALIVRIIENSIRDKFAWFSARRREFARECPMPPESVLNLDANVNDSHTPSQSVQRHERESWIRLGIEFLDEKKREILVLRLWDNLSFVEIGEKLEISQDTARMRYNRALVSLSQKVGELRRNSSNDAIDPSQI